MKKASELLRSRAASPSDLVQACLKQIERYDSKLHAFITVTSEQALKTAREMDAEQRRGKWRSPLHGIPIALKDNIDTAGVRTTAACELFLTRVPAEDAEVVRRVKEAAPLLSVSSTSMNSPMEELRTSTYFGAVRNPWALDHIAGGSSGGSAAAIAADFCFGTLGTDTAGSIRIPASYCGVVGFKPTYGRVSLRGVIPLSWTLDHCGPICKTVEDSALMLQAIAGYDQLDPATVDVPVPEYAQAWKMRTSKLRLGVPRTPFFDNLDPEVAKAVEASIGVLKKLAGPITEPTVPATFDLVLPVLAPEAYAFHAKSLSESPNRYQPFTRDRIAQFAAGVTAQAHADALRRTNVLRREIKKMFADVDLLIPPTMPKPPETFAESKNFDPIGLQNTSPLDIFGLPTISIPCGFTSSGLPIGLQISGAPFAETSVMALAHAYERETQWHNQRPKLVSG